jgi:hypothetical protein
MRLARFVSDVGVNLTPNPAGKARNVPCIIAVMLATVLGSSLASASSIDGLQIIAVFNSPVLNGSIANSPVAGKNTYLDNTATAVYNFNNGVASSNMNWGTFTGPHTGFLPESTLVFEGNTIPATHSTTPFDIGSLTYLNGTSDLTSVIFGASIDFYAGSVSSANFLGRDSITITTTSNIFGVPGGLTSGDDDYLNICGPLSGICATSIEAVESSEGGTGLVVNLTGTIAGDPTMKISKVDVAPGQNSTINGALRMDPPIGAITPEPASFMLVGGALLLAGLFRSRFACFRNGRT